MWLLLWLGIWSIYMLAAVLVCRAAWQESKTDSDHTAEAESQKNQAQASETEASGAAEDTQSQTYYDVREKPPWFWY